MSNTDRQDAESVHPAADSASGARIGFEEKLWKAADGLRGHIEPAEYKHIVLELLFLKYLSDQADRGTATLAVPPLARWRAIMAEAHDGKAASTLGTARRLIEAANPSLQGLLIDDNRRLSNERLIALLEVLDSIPLGSEGATFRDTLGRVYEYFLAHFATAEGRSGGEYYTPRSVVQLLVEMIQPFSGVVYDPCCGTAGMFVQSHALVRRHGGSLDTLRVYGQESSATTWRLARMNLAVRGISADLGPRPGDTFADDLHPDLAADYILANPPFNAKDWGAARLAIDRRWRFGVPPSGNANYAWIQHIFHHLKADGVAGFVLANGALSSDQAGERQLRRSMIEADIIECVVSLPGRLFYGTQIPASLWFVSPNKARHGASSLRGRTLFIDARAHGRLVDRVHAELSEAEVSDIAQTYHRWRTQGAAFRDVPGFARVATTEDIKNHKYALIPGRYVGFAERANVAFDATLVSTEIAEARERLAKVATAMTHVSRLLEGFGHG